MLLSCSLLPPDDVDGLGPVVFYEIVIRSTTLYQDTMLYGIVLFGASGTQLHGKLLFDAFLLQILLT